MRRVALLLGLLLAGSGCGGEGPSAAPRSAPEDPEVAQNLERLESEDARVRFEAARALSNTPRLPARAVRPLAEALGDENRWVRDRAARALARFGQGAAPAIPELIQALEDPDGFVRWRSAKVLAGIGPEARDALPRLEMLAAADDATELDRHWATEALRSIRGTLPAPEDEAMSRAVTPTPTPNPNALRFSLGEDALGSTSRSFASAEDAAQAPWAARLFGVPGVESLFAVRDFVTVTKSPTAEWETIVPHVIEILQTADLD